MSRRIVWLRLALAIAFLVSLAFSYPLFLFSRQYPLSPLLDGVPPIPFPVDAVLVCALAALLVAVAVSSRPRPYLTALLLLLLFYGLTDQGRWYPSYYEYTAIFVVLTAGAWRRDQDRAAGDTLATLRLIVACVYFWSGLQKLNPGFPDAFYAQFVGPLTDAVPVLARIDRDLLGVLVPVVEMAIGIGLLTRHARSVALTGALTMHAFIFFSIGPLRYNWNNTAWAWNLGSMALATVLFSRERHASLPTTVFRSTPSHAMALVLFGLMPLGSFFGVWDSALSFNVYSGNTTTGVLYFRDDAVGRLPPDVRRHVHIVKSPFLAAEHQLHVLPIERWTDHEFHAGPYPERRMFSRVLADLCRQTDPDGVTLEVRTRRDWIHAAPRVFYETCRGPADRRIRLDAATSESWRRRIPPVRIHSNVRSAQ
jgi:uncharacterized membrane protein YphA (DoxX/SURF4 family)